MSNLNPTRFPLLFDKLQVHGATILSGLFLWRHVLHRRPPGHPDRLVQHAVCGRREHYLRGAVGELDLRRRGSGENDSGGAKG